MRGAWEGPLEGQVVVMRCACLYARKSKDLSFFLPRFHFFFMAKNALVRYLYDEVRYYTGSENAWTTGALTHDAKVALDKRLARICSVYSYAVRYADDHGFASINDKYIWLTVRPHDDKQPPVAEFVASVRKFATKKYILSYCYAFEQKGENTRDMGKGMHFHLWAEFSNSYSAITRTVKDMWPGMQYKLFQSPQSFTDDKINYMMGKKDKEKMKAVYFDKMWRHKYSIAMLYIDGFEVPKDDMGRIPDWENEAFTYEQERDDFLENGRPQVL